MALLAVSLLAACTSGAGSELASEPPTAAPPVDLPEATSTPPGEPVARELFGTHVGLLATGTQPVPARAGAIRLWDAGVAWRQLEPEQGQVDWALLDTAVAQAEKIGAADIQWVHGSPPQWAALDPEAPGLYGPGTSSAPDEGAYLDILRQVAQRYQGRITSYQVWNEANIKIFYRGKPDYLAELTLKAKNVLDEVDPDALLIGASTTVRSAGPVKPWYGKYSAALAERGWPVDAMAVHLYPLADQGVDTRATYVRLMRDWLAERGWTGPVWDTEVNFGDRRDFATEIVVVPQEVAAGWVARTYIDSLALGIDRVYWYGWNIPILGIDQVDTQTGAILPAGQAYLTVQDWFDGAYWQGCTGELMEPTGEDVALTTCDLATGDRLPAQILFTHSGSTSVPMPEGAIQVCRLDGTCEPASGESLEITAEPILVRLAG
ncbi:MAG: beta-galactosidase [Candidatus Nanopelagicales bacterium]|nr:beta-galactosidase [Candidatus Nanopelagicales bacterium]